MHTTPGTDAFLAALPTYLAMMTGPARCAVAHKAVDLVLAVAVDAGIRLALVDVCSQNASSTSRDIIMETVLHTTARTSSFYTFKQNGVI